MARERISCFTTPTLERASASTSGFYEWMFNGARAYEVFADTYPILRTDRHFVSRRPLKRSPTQSRARCSDVTLPSAKQKRTQRRRLLEELGFDSTQLKSIDALNTALCAVTAQRLIQGKMRAYGDDAGGYIFVPKPH